MMARKIAAARKRAVHKPPVENTEDVNTVEAEQDTPIADVESGAPASATTDESTVPDGSAGDVDAEESTESIEESVTPADPTESVEAEEPSDIVDDVPESAGLESDVPEATEPETAELEAAEPEDDLAADVDEDAEPAEDGALAEENPEDVPADVTDAESATDETEQAAEEETESATDETVAQQEDADLDSDVTDSDVENTDPDLVGTDLEAEKTDVAAQGSENTDVEDVDAADAKAEESVEESDGLDSGDLVAPAVVSDEAEAESPAETSDEIHAVRPAKAPKVAKSPKPAKAPRTPKLTQTPATAKAPKTHKRHPILAAGLAALSAVLVVGGAVGGATYFFRDHAKPGLELMGEPVTGMTATEVATLAATLSSEYTVTFQMGNVLTTASATDAGVTFDTDSTVSSIMEPANTSGFLSTYNPFVPKEVVLAINVDEKRLQRYLDETFIAADKRQVPAGVAFDQAAGAFAVVSSVDGVQADAAAVAKALKAGEGLSDAIEVPTRVEPPFISNETIQETVDAANARLAAAYTFTNGGATYSVPSATVRGWLDVVINDTLGTASITYDEAAVKASLPNLLNTNLATPATNTEIMVGPEGQHLAVVQYGVDGTVVAGMDSLTQATYDALVAGTGLSMPVTVEYQAAQEAAVPMDPEYTVAGGEKWMELNLSAFTLTRWEGTTKLRTYVVALGRVGTPTRPGIFHVWMKLASQDMYGVDDGVPWRYDGVPWISYFDGGRAIHGVYWHVAFGTRASHGCAGMWVGEAREVFEWDEVGTMVIAHY